MDADVAVPRQPTPPHQPTALQPLLLLLLLPLQLHLDLHQLQPEPKTQPVASGSRIRWMSVGADNAIPRAASSCNSVKNRSLRVPYTCRGLGT